MDTRDLIITSRDAGDSRDAIIISLVSEYGLTLNAATREYAAVAKEEGWTVSRESRKADALEHLALTYGTDWTVEAVRDAIPELVHRFDVQDSTARDYCRAYSEQLGVDHPVEDPRAAMFRYLTDLGARWDEHYEVDAERDAFKQFAGKDGGLGRSASNINEYWKGFELALAIIAKREA